MISASVKACVSSQIDLNIVLIYKRAKDLQGYCTEISLRRSGTSIVFTKRLFTRLLPS